MEGLETSFSAKWEKFIVHLRCQIRFDKPTKAKARSFGKAAKIGKLIREELLPLIPFAADGKMQTRLVSSIFKWLNESGGLQTDQIKNLSMLNHFQFSTEGPELGSRWKPGFAVTFSKEAVQIDLPAFISKLSVPAPPYTQSLRLKCSATAIDAE